MGFGHRVYKNYDPRATVMKQICDEVLEEIGDQDDPLLKVAQELEKIALNDEYLDRTQAVPQRRLLFRHNSSAMGFPTTMFTVLFAMARTVGWISQWKEMFEDP